MVQLRRRGLARRIMLLVDSTRESQREAKRIRRLIAREQAWKGELRIERIERLRSRLCTLAERKASP